ncbi:MAG: hypothetical protein ACHP8A_20005 [Terriglobales bacterium]
MPNDIPADLKNIQRKALAGLLWSKQFYHFGLTFLLAPSEPASPSALLRFQQRLSEADRGIIFDVVQRGGEMQAATFVRRSPPLQVGIGSPGPGGPPLMQLAMTAPDPHRRLEDFMLEAEDILAVFREVWPTVQQSVTRSCSIHSLYPVLESHAFRFLWEDRLQQSNDSLRALERPVLGGGLRLVLPPPPDQPAAPAAEVRIESFFRDVSKVFVETTFTWNSPTGIDDSTLPSAMLKEVSEYEDGPVINFLMSSGTDHV